MQSRDSFARKQSSAPHSAQCGRVLPLPPVSRMGAELSFLANESALNWGGVWGRLLPTHAALFRFLRRLEPLSNKISYGNQYSVFGVRWTEVSIQYPVFSTQYPVFNEAVGAESRVYWSRSREKERTFSRTGDGRGSSPLPTRPYGPYRA